MAGNSSTIGSGIVTGLAALCVALRFYVRIRIKVGIGWDDWLILLGLLLTLLAGALVIYGIRHCACSWRNPTKILQVQV